MANHATRERPAVDTRSRDCRPGIQRLRSEPGRRPHQDGTLDTGPAMASRGSNAWRRTLNHWASADCWMPSACFISSAAAQ